MAPWALPTLVPALGIDQVITTIADAPQASLRRILRICEGIPVKAQMIPAMYDLLQGRVSSAGSSDGIRAFLGAFLPEAQMNGGANGAAPPAA